MSSDPAAPVAGTDDLLTRIRERPNDAPLPTEYLLDDAAAEIARLRAMVKELRTKLQQAQVDTFEEMVKVQDWLDKLVDGWANGRDLNETLLKEVCRYLGKPWP